MFHIAQAASGIATLSTVLNLGRGAVKDRFQQQLFSDSRYRRPTWDVCQQFLISKRYRENFRLNKILTWGAGIQLPSMPTSVVVWVIQRNQWPTKKYSRSWRDRTSKALLSEVHTIKIYSHDEHHCREGLRFAAGKTYLGLFLFTNV